MAIGRSRLFSGAVTVLLVSAGAGLVLAPPASAAVPVVTATLVRTIATSSLDPPLPDPAGVAYLPSRDSLLVSDSEVDETPVYEGSNLLELSRTGAVRARGVTTVYTKEPAGVGIDPAGGHAFVSDDDQQRVYEIAPGTDGRYGTADDTRTFVSTGAFGSTDPEDVAFFPPTGELFVLDGADHDVHRVSPGPNGRFDGVPPTGDDVHTEFDVRRYGAEDPEGIGFHPGRGTLLIVDSTSDSAYELNREAMLISRVDIGAAGQRFAAGITVAPATDDPARLDLYVVDRGVDNDSDPSENDGKLYELRATLPPIVNLAPMVDAGPDAPATAGSPLPLTATVRDDGLPTSSVSLTWTKVSGPGTVTFSPPGAARTAATFGAAGGYVVRASATDGTLTGTDDVTVTVVPPGDPLPLDTPVAKAFDDVETRSSGFADWLGSTLNIPRASGTAQTVGIRFDGLAVPPGSTVTAAWIQFRAAGSDSAATSVQVRGIDEDDTPTFTTSPTTVTSRPQTAAAVTWSPPAWTAGDAGPAQRTAGLRAVVAEVVGRAGWRTGNALAVAMTGTGERRAWSHDGTTPPVLHVEYLPPDSTPPPPTGIAFRAAAQFAGNTTSAPVTVPAAVRAGDQLLLFATVNVASATVTPPAGWTQVADFVTGSARTLAWRRVAGTADPGGTAVIGFSGFTKVVAQMVAYQGVDPAGGLAAVATAAETVETTSHRTPTASVASAGSWVVSYWADKSSTTTDWVPPAAVVSRAEAINSGSGRIAALVADSGAGVAAGGAGGLVATTDAPSRAATMTLVLHPA